MQVADYVVKELIKYDVTDTFGVPGGVVLKFLRAMKKHEPIVTPHLNYHEQMAGFAACGYAQAKGTLGVAYATRGPGITNMITCIAEAYQESLPVLFITAHGNRTNAGEMRFENNQEIDVVSMVSHITKFASNINSPDEVERLFNIACKRALSGRKGPVLLDFSAAIWDKEMQNISNSNNESIEPYADIQDDSESALVEIKKQLQRANHPVILIGDGIRHTIESESLYSMVDNLGIPVLSSRGSQDLLSGSRFYFGYIGSHGIRYSNFILSKADLIISIGNRLAFPIESKSFSPIVNHASIIRLDIDEGEFSRSIPGSKSYKIDAKSFLNGLVAIQSYQDKLHEWINVCDILRESLDNYDCPQSVLKLEHCIVNLGVDKIYVCDVGNNEFWFSRAFEKAKIRNTVLYSKAYGTLGVALGRAIGAYYATGRDVVCVMGDQGFQYNIQELQYIVNYKLPIKIILMNNHISGMIRDHQKQIFGTELIHVTDETGYVVPDFKEICKAYGMTFTTEESVALKNMQLLYEIQVDMQEELSPKLPKGNECQDMEPLIDRTLYARLNQL